MLDVNRATTIALTSALADWEAGCPPSLVRSARMAGVNAISEPEYELAQIRALAARLGLSERFVAARLRDARSPSRWRSAETIFDLIDLMAQAANHNQEDEWR